MQKFIRSTCKLPFILHVSFQNASLCWSFLSSSHLQFEVWVKNWVTHTVGRWAWLFFYPQADCVKTWATAPSQKVSSRCPRWWLWWVILGKMRGTLWSVSMWHHKQNQTVSEWTQATEWLHGLLRLLGSNSADTVQTELRARWKILRTCWKASWYLHAYIHTYIHTN